MYKAKYSDIKRIIENTDWENGAFTKGEQPYCSEIAYYAPQGNNWAYRIGIAVGYDNNIYEIVTVFGEIKGYRYLLNPQKDNKKFVNY
jgi:hypothetical protein